MHVALAVGVPAWADVSRSWDLTPFLVCIGALLIARTVLRVRLRWPVILGCVAIGALVPELADAWGLTVTIACAAIATAALGVVLSRNAMP